MRGTKEVHEMNELDKMCGVTDEELLSLFTEAIRQDNEQKKAKGVPLACYDADTGKAYLEYANGAREYVS